MARINEIREFYSFIYTYTHVCVYTESSQEELSIVMDYRDE